MNSNATRREGREGQGRASKNTPFPVFLPSKTRLGKGGNGVTTPYSARAREDSIYIECAATELKRPLPVLPVLPKGFFCCSKLGKGVSVSPSRPSRYVSRGTVRVVFLAAAMFLLLCGGSTPDPTTVPPVVIAPAL